MLTEQEIFDTVARALLAQGRPAVNVNKCRYRTPDGAKCAAGHLLPDDEYESHMEGCGVGGLVYFEDFPLPLLRDLQNAHDGSGLFDSRGTLILHQTQAWLLSPKAWLSQWKEAMHVIAKKHNLNPEILNDAQN